MQNKIKSDYHNNGIIYLPDFLDSSSLLSIHNEIEQGKTAAENDLRKNWNNTKTCFYSKNAVKSATPQQDYVTQPYFLASRDKAHIFYEEIENVLAVNRIGHGLHLLPEFKTIQDMTYHNDRLTSLLKTIGFIRPVCQLSVYIPKFPNSIGSEVNPHQESTFAHTQPTSVVVLWIALEDACIDNACMWGIMGSHKWPLQYVSRVDHVNKTRHFERVNHDIHIPDFKSQKDSFTPLEVKAGDAILFHGNFVHCSPANQSARSRKALSLQFIETFNVSYTTSNWLQPPNHDYIFDQKTEMEVS